MQEGRLKSFEDVATGGVETFPETLLRLFSGENLGKLVLEVDPGERHRNHAGCDGLAPMGAGNFPRPLRGSKKRTATTGGP